MDRPEGQGTAQLEPRLALGHAAVQVVADAAGIRILHIKGIALDSRLVWPGRTSTDVDVLVEPLRSGELVHLLLSRGWELCGGFATSSAFEHSATLHHEYWGYLDVHRAFPGPTVPPTVVFDSLWADRRVWTAAAASGHIPCLPAQRLLLLLHAARSGQSDRGRRDVAAAWEEADEEDRVVVRALANRLGAEVALAAALGELDQWSHRREHDLWRVVSQGGTRVEEWRARIKAAPNLRGKLRVASRSIVVNIDHLAMVRGHHPTRREVVVEFFARPGRGIREELFRRGRRS